MEYEPPVANSLIVRCKLSRCCCISASVRSIFLLEQCLNEWRLAPVQSRTVFLDGTFSLSAKTCVAFFIRSSLMPMPYGLDSSLTHTQPTRPHPLRLRESERAPYSGNIMIVLFNLY